MCSRINFLRKSLALVLGAIGVVFFSPTDAPAVTITASQSVYVVSEDGQGTAVFTVTNDTSTVYHINDINSRDPRPAGGDTALDALIQNRFPDETCFASSRGPGSDLGPGQACTITYHFRAVDNDPSDSINPTADVGM